MARRPSAPSEQSTNVGAKKRVAASLDGATPLLTPWDILNFRPLREVAAIADPEERRLAALLRLEQIQKMAANRARSVKTFLKKDPVVIYDPDGNTIVKAEEIIQRLLAVEPMKPMSGDNAAAMAAFANPPPKPAKLEAVK